MTDQRYFGMFSDVTDVAREFRVLRTKDDHIDDLEVNDRMACLMVGQVIPAWFPEDHEVLVAAYTYEDYSGSAFILYERDGKLYEVHGGHCSCDGLEGQWQAEETTWEALQMRPWGSDGHYSSGVVTWCEVAERMKTLFDNRSKPNRRESRLR